MKVLHRFPHPALAEPAVVTIGTFDGPHLGHARLISKVVRDARKRGAASLLVTFTRNPAGAVHDADIPRLTSRRTRKKRIAEIGIDYFIEVRFTRQIMRCPAEEFIQSYLLRRCRMVKLVIGHDFTFGSDCCGGAVLRQQQQRYGFDLSSVPSVRWQGEIVSSSCIRQALQRGNVAKAGSMLGHTFAVNGKLQHRPVDGKVVFIPTEKNLCLPKGVFYGSIKYLRTRKSIPAGFSSVSAGSATLAAAITGYVFSSMNMELSDRVELRFETAKKIKRH